MFQRIVLAYSDSPDSRRALTSAIQLVKTFGAELQAVIAMRELPAYTAFVTIADSSFVRTVSADRQLYEQLQVTVREIARSNGVELQTELLEGGEVDAIIQLLHRCEADLVVIGLHRHTSHISRLWNRVFEIAQNAPCSVLGVH